MNSSSTLGETRLDYVRSSNYTYPTPPSNYSLIQPQVPPPLSVPSCLCSNIPDIDEMSCVKWGVTQQIAVAVVVGVCFGSMLSAVLIKCIKKYKPLFKIRLNPPLEPIAEV